MKYALLLIIILFIANCSKPKTVLICGDHICVNTAEAEQYFQENLTIEVKVIDKKVKDEMDLVELNLKKNQSGKNKISILSKKDTNKELKILSNEEISKIKKKIKNNSKEKKIAKKTIKKKKESINNEKKIKNSTKEKKIAKKTIEKKQESINKEKKITNEEKKILEYKINKKHKDIVDVCSIIRECSIDEISKYLLKRGQEKDFPNITTR